MGTLKIIVSVYLAGHSMVSFSQKPDWQYFSMTGEECRIFATNGNSRIIVPANCFELDGKPYSGPLQIAFKEYKDQADFILGGLSLRYEINGSLKTLQSGGMFEMDIKSGEKNARTLVFAPRKKITVKFAIDPHYNIGGLEPFYFEPVTKKWVKNTRFGNTRESNQPLSDKNSELWQDDPQIAEFSDDPEFNGDDRDGGCYTLQVRDPGRPDMFIDSIICPSPYNPLDSRYAVYLSDQAFKTMQIDKMGLYNFDKIFNDENNVPMFVRLKTKEGKPFDLKDKLYVVYKNSNSVIYYFKGDLEYNFSLIPRNDIRIFAYSGDGTISRVPDSFWKNFDAKLLKGKTIDLPFETIKLATLSKDEFALATGLKN